MNSLYIFFVLLILCKLSSSIDSFRKLEEDTASNPKVDDSKEYEYDSHGCCKTTGEFYCHNSGKCVGEWDSCSFGWFDTQRCQYFYNNTLNSFSYDLSKYALPIDKYYTILDSIKHDNIEFQYYFNFCRHIDSINLPISCATTTGTDEEVCSKDAFAYQYFKTSWGDEACFRLSDCVEQVDQKIEMGIIDPIQPAMGIYIKYYGKYTYFRLILINFINK